MLSRRARFAQLRRLERATEHYLDACYRARTAARVSEFAVFLRVSQPYLSRIVPEIAGQPVRDFLRARQLAHAVGLLRSTPLRVAEIAIECAFGTASTFHRCFVRAFGKTPAAYRDEVTKCESPSELRFPSSPRHPERRLLVP